MIEFSQFLYTKLAADSNLVSLLGGSAKVYDGLAPQEVSPPYVIYQMQAAEDHYALGDLRAYIAERYLVRAVSIAFQFVEADNLAKRIDAAIHGASGLVGSTFQVKLCYRERDFQRADDYQGVRYNYSGGFYRLIGWPVEGA